MQGEDEAGVVGEMEVVVEGVDDDDVGAEETHDDDNIGADEDDNDSSDCSEVSDSDFEESSDWTVRHLVKVLTPHLILIK